MTIARLLLCGVLPVLVAWWTYEAAMRSWRSAQAEPGDADGDADTDDGRRPDERPARGELVPWLLFQPPIPALLVGIPLAIVPVFGTYLGRVAVLVLLPMLAGGAIGLRRGALRRPRPGDEPV